MVVDAEEVNLNAMDALLVVEPLVTLVDVMVMVGGGGRSRSTLVPPKNVWLVEGEVKPNLPLFIVIVRLSLLPKKALKPIDVTEFGMFMDVKLLHDRKALTPIDATELPIVTDVKPRQALKTSESIDVTKLGIVIDFKPLHSLKH